jgi:uncharacterized protein
LLIIIGILIVVVAGFIQGLTSFGFALIAMPILAKIIPLNEAVPIVVILSLFINIIILVQCIKYVDLKRIWILIIASLAAAPLGTYSLVFLNPNILKLFTGVLIVSFAILLLKGKSFPVKNEKIAYVPVGLLSGFLNGSVSMSGPPVALFLSNQNVGINSFRANITAYAIILNIFTIITYFYSGLLNNAVLAYTAWFIPSMIIGVLIGVAAIRKLNDVLFKRISLGLIIISGIWTILNSVLNIIK